MENEFDISFGKCIDAFDEKKIATAKIKNKIIDAIGKCGSKNKIVKADLMEEIKKDAECSKASIPDFFETYETIFESMPENGIESDEDRFNREMALQVADMMVFNKSDFTSGHSLLKFDEPNGNGDIVPYDECQNICSGMEGQAVTYNHDPNILIGGIIKTKLYQPLRILLVISRLWEARPESRKYAQEARKIYNETGLLPFSFEIMFDTAECSVCGGKFASKITGPRPYKHYCDHLKDKKTSGACRILRDCKPLGEAVVLGNAVPAYRDSATFVAASKDKMIILQEKIDQLEKLLNK